jgi:hypothetical protein
MPSRRTYRVCPACRTMHAASDLPRVRTPGARVSGWGGARWTRCPACGHEGALLTFPLVAPPGEGGGANRPELGVNR